ncbi:MAG: efflux RND transporter periplasmic adaptor subunit [Gemmatimonadota bacterium]
MTSKQHGWVKFLPILALGLLAGCGSESGSSDSPAHVENPVQESDLTTIHLTEEAEGRIGIELGAVEDRSLQRRRSFGGELMASPGSEVFVTAPRAGMIVGPEGGRIPGAGSSVEAGQSLLRLVVLPSGDELLGGGGSLEGAEARLDNARAKATRARELLGVGVASQAEAEDAEAELRSSQSALDAVRARSELLESGTTGMDLSSLSPIVLTAPAAGIVHGVHVAPGQIVSAGMPLLEIVGANPLWVRVPVYVGVLADVDRAVPVTVVTPGAPDDSPGFEATPIAGPPTANAGTVSSDLYYRVANPGGDLRPGERVAVRVPMRGSASVERVVPWSAVLYDIQGGTWIYEALENHSYTRRRVEVRDVVEGFAILTRGPAPGTPVVVVGAAELYSTEFGTAH